MTIKEINKLNPNPGVPYKDYEIVIDGSVMIRLYQWMLKEDQQEDILVNRRQLVHYIEKLCLSGMTVQLYFDVVVLGITDESQRPKCRVCGADLKFDCIGHGGYPATCSKECHKVLKREDYLKNNRMLKLGDKHAPESLKKISEATLRTRPWENPEWKKKHSEHMKEFAKTPEGQEFYKYVGQKAAEANFKKSLDPDKPKHLYNSKLYKKGVYRSEVYNLDFVYDSGWELEFIKYMEQDELKDQVRVFDRSRVIIPYQLEDGSEHRYQPDFFIMFNSGLKVVVEIKPNYMLNNDSKVIKKIQAGRDFYKNTKIHYLVLTEKEMLDHNKIKKDFDLIAYLPLI